MRFYFYSFLFFCTLFFSCASNDNTSSAKEAQQGRLLYIANEYQNCSKYSPLHSYLNLPVIDYDAVNKFNRDRAQQALGRKPNQKETDSITMQWAIADCPAIVTKFVPDSFHFSMAALKQSPHGDKLYQLYVKNLNYNINTSTRVQPLTQVLVKEIWNVKASPEKIPSDAGLPWIWEPE